MAALRGRKAMVVAWFLLVLSSANADYRAGEAWVYPTAKCYDFIPERYELFSSLGCDIIQVCDAKEGHMTQSCVKGYFNGTVCVDAQYVHCRDGKRPLSAMEPMNLKIEKFLERYDGSPELKVEAEPSVEEEPKSTHDKLDLTVCHGLQHGRASVNVDCHQFMVCRKGVAIDIRPCPFQLGVRTIFEPRLSRCVLPWLVEPKEGCETEWRAPDRPRTAENPRKLAHTAAERVCLKSANRGKNVQLLDEIEESCKKYIRCSLDGRATVETCSPEWVFDQVYGVCVRKTASTRSFCKNANKLQPGVDDEGWPLCPRELNLDQYRDHQRVGHPTDCKKFKVCFAVGGFAKGGCNDEGEAFDERVGLCKPRELVPGCENA